ncbi:MAG: ATP-binding protein [Dehalococcoidia bacterium]|nr:ATP-binding protein [Dehalococcoidia bacterium]
MPFRTKASAKERFKALAPHSIQLRVLLLVFILVLAAMVLLAAYTLDQFEKSTRIELEHEGLLLSSALEEAGIVPLAEARDIPGLQERINTLSSALRNAIEVNVILLKDDGSAIVASNIPGNIRETSTREHEVLLEALSRGGPVVFTGRNPEHEGRPAPSGTPIEASPEPHFFEAHRFLSVTTPLTIDGQKLGSINVKVSLDELHEDLVEVRWTIIAAASTEIALVLGGLIFLLNIQVFRPLRRMGVKMRAISGGDLTQRIGHQGSENEIGELANTFDRMLDQLQASFEREKRFTTDAAHELRTPLAALKGQIEVALSRYRSQEEYRDTLQDLQEEVDRLTRLSGDLLLLARLGQGRLQPRFERVDLSDLLGAIADQMRPSADLKGINLTEKVPPDITMQGDADHLIRLFLNLLDNAIKYTPPGGRVVLEAEATLERIRISVSDTGPGIPEEHLPFLFDRFYRVETARSRDTGGAGLGLSIVYELARSHHGTIAVDSKPGQGTIFTVELPRNPQ